ncbi:MAG TPA: acyl carrier protein [Gammaproteobacteria bacterium]
MAAVSALSREQIFAELKRELCELFDLDPAQVTLEARLNDDLDLDSIDAVDLAVRLQDLTNKRIRPEQFKAVRTVKDVVDAVEDMLRA